jgi:excisionase family DNA binding protein
MSISPELPRTSRTIADGPLAVSPNEAAALMGIGRTKLYDLRNDGKIRFKKIGSRSVIAVAEILKFLSE